MQKEKYFKQLCYISHFCFSVSQKEKDFCFTAGSRSERGDRRETNDRETLISPIIGFEVPTAFFDRRPLYGRAETVKTACVDAYGEKTPLCGCPYCYICILTLFSRQQNLALFLKLFIRVEI